MNTDTQYSDTSDRTYQKDVLRLCKGHYDHELYENTIEAIRAYQAKWSGSNVEHITDHNVLSFLSTVVEEFFTAKHWAELFKERLYKDYLNSIYTQTQMVVNIEYFLTLLIQQLASLQVRTTNVWIIDLSAYEDGSVII